MKLRVTLLFSCFAFVVAACSSNPTPDEPAVRTKTAQSRTTEPERRTRTSDTRTKTSKVQPQTIRIEAPTSGRTSPTAKPQLIEKDLFNVKVANNMLEVNGTPIKNLKVLEEILGAYDKPVITVAAHICMQASATSEILTLAQSYTDSPIAFGSWGTYDDNDCGI